jgi:hypothetical protein
MIPRLMRVARRVQLLIIVVGAVVFGAADQYLGSRVALGEWTVAVSQMSAPWLAIAFAAGAWPNRRMHAMAMGTGITLAAVVGYMAMTLSPLEGVAPSSIHWWMELRSQLHIVLPALVTGPVFGWLGWRWRRDRDLAPALVVAAIFALEPLARIAANQMVAAHSFVWPAEVAGGVALAVSAVVFRRAPAR